MTTSNYTEIPEEKSVHIGGIIGIIIGIVISLLFTYCLFFAKTGYWERVNGVSRYHYIPIYQETGLAFLMVLGIIFGIAIIVFGMRSYKNSVNEAKNSKEDIKNIKQYNEIENIRIAKNTTLSLEIKKQWNTRADYLQKEYNKVNTLLSEYYNLNILANPYRNLASLYYIYDYMSSSRESLQDTLIHEHMENGIQRILAKLDYIINQNQEIIFQNRIAEANNQKIINQNQQMLQSLKQTERNTAQATQYAEISANYSKANAYFSLANYLKN